MRVTDADRTDSPGDSVQYIAAHDGLTWHDTVAYSMNIEDPAAIYRRLKLGNLVCLTAQGTAFLHAGQEYGRTKEYFGEEEDEILHDEKSGKKYVRNSYNASDRINMIDWSRINSPQGQNLFKYTQGLIAIRRVSDAFRRGTSAFIAVSRIAADEEKASDLVFGFKVSDSEEKYMYYVFKDADMSPRSFTVDGIVQAVCNADAEEAGILPIALPSGVAVSENTVTLQPLTGAVFRK